MKKIGPICLVLRVVVLTAALLGAASCKKPSAETSEEGEQPAPATAETTPKATPAVVVAAATPDPLAPPGTFFLLQKTSIKTEDGILGFKPGQVLKEMSPGVYLAGGQQLKLKSSEVTNNLRIAGQLAAADAASQQALWQALRPKATPPPAPSTASVGNSSTVPPGRPSTVVAEAPKRPPSTPASTIVAGGSGNTASGSRLGAGTGFADPETGNRRAEKVDSTGRRYWRDSHGNIRYDF